MARNTRGSKEYSREQRLSKENKHLKREIARLNKILARLDLDRYSTIKEMVQEHTMADKAEKTQDLLESLKAEWKCHKCEEGHLEIVVFSKLGNPWYFRSCNSCSNRTLSQVYDSSKVKGIIKNKN